MRLGLDLDGVLADFDSSYRQLIEEVTQRPLPVADPTVWDWPVTCGVTPEEEAEVWRRIHHSREFWAALGDAPNFTADTCRALADISRFHDVYFITARPSRYAKHQTEQWLIRHGLPPCALMTEHKGLAAKVLNLHVYVDDRPENVLATVCESPTTRTYLQRRSWNRTCTHMPAIATLDELFEREGL